MDYVAIVNIEMTDELDKIEKKEPVIMEFGTLLVYQYYAMQKHRVAFGLQLYKNQKTRTKNERSIQLNGSPITNEQFAKLEQNFDSIYAVEKSIDKEILRLYRDHPMSEWLSEIKGIGHIIGLSLLSTLDPRKTKHVSSFWKYCGLAPDSKRVKGEKLSYNPFAKQICFKIGESFIKCGAGQKYRKRYDDCKELYQKNMPDASKMHVHLMARRKAVKLFLADFWVAWRTHLNLPVSEPYSHKYKSNYKKPL